MRVLVCGGRDYEDYHMVCDVLDHICAVGDIIIQGGAKGADGLARRYALSKPLECKTYPAEWSKYGKSAGPRRNEEMLKHGKPELVVAFPGGVGTSDMVQRAKKAGIEVIEAA